MQIKEWMMENRLTLLTHPRESVRPVVAPAPVEAAVRGAEHARRLRSLLLRVPVLYKILLASGGIVFLTTTVCVLVGVALLGLPLTRPTLSTFVLLALGGALASAPLLVIILRLALRPVVLLAEAAERFERGEAEEVESYFARRIPRWRMPAPAPREFVPLREFLTRSGYGAPPAS